MDDPLSNVLKKVRNNYARMCDCEFSEEHVYCYTKTKVMWDIVLEEGERNRYILLTFRTDLKLSATIAPN